MHIELHNTLLRCSEAGVSADNYVRIHVTDTNKSLKCMREVENESSFQSHVTAVNFIALCWDATS